MPCPLILTNQLRLFDVLPEEGGAKAGRFRGLFCMSVVRAEGWTGSGGFWFRFGEGRGATGRELLAKVRTGVKPDCRVLRTLLTRGVLSSLLDLGRLSAVKAWGGTLSQTSKSSGARLFLPATASVSPTGLVLALALAGTLVLGFSRGLLVNTGARVLSGVFGLSRAEEFGAVLEGGREDEAGGMLVR